MATMLYRHWCSIQKVSYRLLRKAHGSKNNACRHGEDSMIAECVACEMSKIKRGGNYLSQEERRGQRLGWQPQP